MKKCLFPYSYLCTDAQHEGVPAIEVNNLSVNYPHKANVLKNIAFSIKGGSRVALIGANGAGKSTLLKAIVGLIPIRSGSIYIYGHKAPSAKHLVMYLPQRSEIDWQFPITVFKLALTGAYIYLGWFKKPSKENEVAADLALNLLGLSKLADRRIGELSIGEQQRLLLARAMVHNPQLFILDEPFNAVDNETQNILQAVFDRLKGEGKTLLIATHGKEHLSEHFDDVLMLKEGELITKGIIS